MAAGASAHAKEPRGTYVGAGVGPNFLGGGVPRLAGGTGAASAPESSGFNTGLRGDLSLGWAFGTGFRAEIEGTFAGNNARMLNKAKTGTGSTGQRGEATAGVLADVIYDFTPPRLHIGSVAFPLRPYLGAGFGYTSVYRKNIREVALARSELESDQF